MTRAFALLMIFTLAVAACVPTPAVPPTPTTAPPTAAPTQAPPTAVPATAAATPAPISHAPTRFEELEGWLADQWQAGAEPASVQAALQASGWQNAPEQWRTADLNGDGRDEWLVTLIDNSQGAPVVGATGQFWIVNGTGIAFRYDAATGGYFTAPVPKFVADFTGDGRQDVVTDMAGCGASTCFNIYLVITAHGGQLRNVARPAPGAAGPSEDGIGLSNVTNVHLGGTQPETLVITGGTYGSVGAGITRERTETWGWDGAAMALQDTLWAPSNYVHHVLYDGNLAFDENDEQTAVAAYTRVIRDDTLEDVAGNATGESARAAARQFAAFRMALIALRGLDEVQAFNWQEWLHTNAPDTPLARAVDTLMTEWSDSQDLEAACTVVTQQLESETDPTGPLADLGYGNPSLTAKDVCPVAP